MKQERHDRFSFEPQWLVVIGFFCVGLFLGALGIFTWITNKQKVSIQKIHFASSEYEYINPILAVDAPKRQEFLENKVLEQSIQHVIEEYSREGKIIQSSVYFKELETGRWMGISENVKYAVGKPFKLPLLITLFKEAEQDDQFLEQPISQEGTEFLSRGKLIDNMILKQDDQSADQLYSEIDLELIDEIYSDLGLELTTASEGQHTLSPKMYSLLFRILYNATYLQRDFSEKILSLLASDRQLQGISANLPKNINVAHFGETVLTQNSLAYSHDCGITYYPKHPYVVCVLASHIPGREIEPFFQEIGTTIYNDMISKYHLTN